MLKKLSVQSRMVILAAITSMIIILVNILLFLYINRSINEINRVYSTNVTINELSDSLGRVQEAMTEYLNTKSTDSMERYFDAEQEYREKLDQISAEGYRGDNMAVIQNISNLSDTYLKVTEETIQAKRGRVVEKYNISFERAREIYGYINAYIYSLNNEQFRLNSESYEVLRASFRSLELVTMLAILVASVINVFLTAVMTKNIMDPVRQREIVMETHLKDAELKYLQAQVNPHFLFNTLNAGAQLAMMEEADRTYDYIQNMAAFFRYKINRGDKDTTLAQEIGLVDNYIHILNVRFSGEIHFEKEIDEECVNVSVPGMILQPVVENAVNYGIRDIEREKLIRLKVERLPELIRVRVMDNGAGMTEERIREVLSGNAGENPVMKDSNGVGILNVMSRLRLFYDREDVLQMFSEGEGRGTIVDILIPLPEEMKEKENVSDHAGR
ncbi:MAG: histidine kinase [Lachnospiraceae bacterium]|nr:histidine kinase [Lachnospiraceae bacterium]